MKKKIKEFLLSGFACAAILTCCCNAYAEELPQTEGKEQVIGKWDHRAGIISFYSKQVEGVHRVRMLVNEEHMENSASELSIDMSVAELDDLEDMVDLVSDQLDSRNKLPVPPISARESARQVGKLVYGSGTMTFAIVEPPGTQRYVSLVVKPLNRRGQLVFWMEKEDLGELKQLLDKSIDAVGGDPSLSGKKNDDDKSQKVKAGS